jgi:hypothetical protein
MKTPTKIASSVLLAFVAILSTGCAGSTVRFESPKGVSYDSSKGRPVSAKASGFQLLLFIPISINDRHERAYQMLREKAAGDYLTDIRVQESWTYALVGTIYSVRMDATAYPRN